MDTTAQIHQLLDRSIYLILPFALSLTAILLLEKIAPLVGMVDKPDARKFHLGEVPLLGGVAIFFSFAVSVATLTPNSDNLILLSLAFSILLLGFIDDAVGMGSIVRLVLQIGVAYLMVVAGSIQIMHVGSIFGGENLTMAPGVSTVFTIIAVVGVLNAINMLDGLDGLASSILLQSFSALAILAIVNRFYHDGAVLLILTSALFGFYMFNARIFVAKAKIFMGDSGSMFLGFIFSWYLIKLTQYNAEPVSAVAAGWIFGLPLLDTVVVIANRLKRRQSAFVAGRDHLHHKLMDSAGLTVGRTVILMGLIHFIFVMVGIVVSLYPELEPIAFWLFILMVFFHFVATPYLLKKVTTKNKIHYA